MKLFTTFSMEILFRSTGRPYYAIFVCLFLCCFGLKAQQLITEHEDRVAAYQHLTQLRNGTLIVLLKSGAEQVAELEDIISGDKSTASQKKRAEKMLKRLKKEKAQFHSDLISAFNELYTFSEYTFVYDKDLLGFKDGNLNVQLGKDLKPANKEIVGEPYYMKEEYTNPQDGARILSFIIYDKENNRIKHPFPSVKISDTGPVMMLKLIFDSSSDHYREASDIVERLDYKLKHRLAKLQEDVNIQSEN